MSNPIIQNYIKHSNHSNVGFQKEPQPQPTAHRKQTFDDNHK